MNKTLFATAAQTSKNHAGGRAYALSNQQALAQLVATGTLSQTFYVDAQTQLQQVLALCEGLSPEFIAKAAVYARQSAYMKDMPVLLLAVLAANPAAHAEFQLAFRQVIDNGKQLRNFVQMLRSGVVGRQSLGSLPKKLVNQWLLSASDTKLLAASIGNAPSLADVLKMTHPKPQEASREAFFGYVLGKPYQVQALPEAVQQLLAFRQGEQQLVPNVPIQLLMSLPLSAAQWAQIALQGGWQMLRMNLNTFARYKVFELEGMTEAIAARLVDAEAIRSSRVLPYQLLMTWSALDAAVPTAIQQALEAALDIALANVPELLGDVVVAVDVSGSMHSAVTGHRQGATSKLRCVDAAGLFAAALKRVNPQLRIMPFDTQVHSDVNSLSLKERAVAWLGKKPQAEPIRVMALAKHLAAKGGGGTHTALPLQLLNTEQSHVDLMIYFSDNESWADPQRGRGTEMMRQWERLKQRCPNAKLVCVDLQPYTTTQAQERSDVLNIGGFSDEVFRLIGLFARGELQAEHWVHEIEQIALSVS